MQQMLKKRCNNDQYLNHVHNEYKLYPVYIFQNI